jgi:hypothetical protein
LKSLPKRSIPSFFGILRFSSAAAAILLTAVFALDFTQSSLLLSANRSAEDAQTALVMESAKIPAAEAPEAESPMIIFWGAPAPMMGAYGKGGGGGGAEGSGFGGGAPATSFFGIGGGAAEEVLPEAAPLVEELPAAQATPSADMPAPDVFKNQQTETEVQPQTALVPEPLTGSGPILGVRPPEERVSADSVIETPLRQPLSEKVPPLRLIEIVLAAIVLLTAIPAWLLRRK